MYNDEIYHHGVLGQKWGKQNGPPYPLKPSKHSAAEKKAGWKKSLSAKDYTKQLNKMDKDIDRSRRAIQDAGRIKEGIKDWARETGKYEQYDDGYGINFKPSKRDQRIANRFLEADKSQKEAAKVYEKGMKEVDKTINRLKKKGYDVSSKEVSRLSMTGKDYADILAGTLWATALVSAAGVIAPPAAAAGVIKGGATGAAVALTNAVDQKKIKGFKYKVQEPKK